MIQIDKGVPLPPPSPTRPDPEMACHEPDDEPRGPLSGRQILVIAGAALAAWVAIFGLVWLLLEVVS